MATNKAVLGIVNTYGEAETAVSDLLRAGFQRDDLSVLFPDMQSTRDFAFAKNTKAPEGAATGVGVGGAIGGTIGLLAGIGALAIPGLGPFIAAGPILAALSGAAAGGLVGGLTGTLVGLGIPELEAKRYEEHAKKGRILIAVHTENDDEVSRAKRILKNDDVKNIDTIREATR
ncbi:MAG: DUF3341 domain-containing protein [Vicinamibacteria bacterium]|nr:DUF3341 domain-containing protein [Vicinamibacteria bacterium]